MHSFAKTLLIWLIIPISLVSVFLIWNQHGTIDDSEEDNKIREFVQGRCTQPENINRHFLQQSWFYDQKFTHLAGAFGQYSFLLFQKDNKNEEIHGAFCIDGNNLEVTYYQRKFVPIRVRFPEIEFGLKLKSTTHDVFVVKELNANRMILISKNDGVKHIFYRKN